MARLSALRGLGAWTFPASRTTCGSKNDGENYNHGGRVEPLGRTVRTGTPRTAIWWQGCRSSTAAAAGLDIAGVRPSRRLLRRHSGHPVCVGHRVPQRGWARSAAVVGGCPLEDLPQRFSGWSVLLDTPIAGWAAYIYAAFPKAKYILTVAVASVPVSPISLARGMF